MGERLAWYVAWRRDAERPTVEEPGIPRHDRSEFDEVIAGPPTPPSKTSEPDRDRSVAAAILHYRTEHLNRRSRIDFAVTSEATDLIYGNPFAFLIGVVFDEGIVAERAWQAPYELRARVGTLDPYRLRNMDAEVAAAVATPPMLHRYKEIMARATVLAAAKVCDEYGGDAGQIWAPGSTARQVDDRLMGFHKVGSKKSDMAVELLVSDLGVDLADMHRSDVAYDVHVRRVFLRAGLADRDTGDAVRAAARRLHPTRPGELDLPTWFIGRKWCRPTDPDHAGCPLGEVCPRLVERASTVK